MSGLSLIVAGLLSGTVLGVATYVADLAIKGRG